LQFLIALGFADLFNPFRLPMKTVEMPFSVLFRFAPISPIRLKNIVFMPICRLVYSGSLCSFTPKTFLLLLFRRFDYLTTFLSVYKVYRHWFACFFVIFSEIVGESNISF